MVKVSIFDTIHLSPRPDSEIRLTVRPIDPPLSASHSRHEIPAGPQNLVVRSAEALRHHAGIRYGADIVLEKRIPSEAGLAGGSGNAAAALAGLNQLWQLGLGQATLADLGASLGSDVPFFLSAGTAALASGRGERIGSIPCRGPLHFVIVKPPFGLSTAAVYQAFTKQPQRTGASAQSLTAALAAGDVPLIARNLRNDLEAAAEQIAPQVREIRARLMDECRYGAMMTGSGSACFGICGTAREATASAARLRAARIGQVFATTTA
jgi:4-diphosphocytidyl-2-C-methyl-D-erythritol kinase